MTANIMAALLDYTRQHVKVAPCEVNRYVAIAGVGCPVADEPPPWKDIEATCAWSWCHDRIACMLTWDVLMKIDWKRGANEKEGSSKEPRLIHTDTAEKKKR